MPRRASEQATGISPHVRGDLEGSLLRHLAAPALRLVSLHPGYGIQVAAKHLPRERRVQTRPRSCPLAPLLRTLEAPLFAGKVRSFLQNTQSNARCKLVESLYTLRAINGYGTFPINHLRPLKLRHFRELNKRVGARTKPIARA